MLTHQHRCSGCCAITWVLPARNTVVESRFAVPARCISMGRPCGRAFTPASAAEGKAITTIEGLSTDASHPVQRAWVELDTPQCGYCQPGMIMAAAALLADNPQPSDEDINSGITNICRCGTFPKVREGVHRAAALAADDSEEVAS